MTTTAHPVPGARLGASSAGWSARAKPVQGAWNCCLTSTSPSPAPPAPALDADATSSLRARLLEAGQRREYVWLAGRADLLSRCADVRADGASATTLESTPDRRSDTS